MKYLKQAYQIALALLHDFFDDTRTKDMQQLSLSVLPVMAWLEILVKVVELSLIIIFPVHSLVVSIATSAVAVCCSSQVIHILYN